MTLAEEEPDYAEKISAYLAKVGARRVPWGMRVAGGGVVQTVTSKEIRDRHELGETAIALLHELGVTAETLEVLNDHRGPQMIQILEQTRDAI